MKKVLSFALIMVMVLSIPVSFAGNVEKLPNKLYITNEKGAYRLGVKGELRAKKTKTPGIYELENGEYVSYNDGKIYPVKRSGLNLADKEAVKSYIKNNSDLPKEVIKEIKSESRKAIKNDLKYAFVVVTQPDDSGISTRSTSTVISEYNGYPIKDVSISYFNIPTKTYVVAEGLDTSDVASSIIDITLSGAGFVGGKISSTASGVSLLKAFFSEYGTESITGSTSDMLEIKIYYDRTNKYTYIDKGSGWQIGLTSQAVYVNSIKHVHNYVNHSVGREVELREIINEATYSENYFNTGETAYIYSNNAKYEKMNSIIHGINIRY